MSAITPDTARRTGRAPAEFSPLERLCLRLSAMRIRLTRWEFWPSWAIYAPLVPYVAYLAVRHRSLLACTHANPGIPLGGVVGESKWEILRLLPSGSIVPTALIPPGPRAPRIEAIQRAVADGGWTWPIILKPDVGERGRGVRAIANLAEARAYIEASPDAVLAQRRHPGPYEAGVFYYRFPGQPKGRILSLTDKRFAAVLGDGRASIRALIWRHPRYRAQAPAMLRQLGTRADVVPAAGESVQVGAIGNHCRGAMFLDGAHLITPALEAAFDVISRQARGFFFGRFDVRYADAAEFASGRGFEIVELNGLLSESTNIYDPGTTFRQAQRTLRTQWKLAFEIGAANLRSVA